VWCVVGVWCGVCVVCVVCVFCVVSVLCFVCECFSCMILPLASKASKSRQIGIGCRERYLNETEACGFLTRRSNVILTRAI